MLASMNKRKQFHQRHVTASSTDIVEAGDVEVEKDPDNSKESASLIEPTSVACKVDGPPVLSVTQYTCTGKVVYCISDADQVDLQPVPIIDKEDPVFFQAFNLGQNFQVKEADSPSQSLNPNRKRKGVNHDGIVANISKKRVDEATKAKNTNETRSKDIGTIFKKRVDETTKAKNTNETRSKDIGTISPSTRKVKTIKKTSKPATPQTLSTSEKEANAIAKEEKLKAKKRSLTCSECGKVSLCKYQHNNHVGSHTRKRQRIEANKVNLKCSECGKVSLCKYQHNNHVESHVRRKEKYRKCPNCEERFPSRKTLAVHKQAVHGRTKRTFQPKDLLPCTHCGKKFKYKSDLEKHIQSHTNTRKFKCSYCSMTFHRYINHLVHEYNNHERIKEDGQEKVQVKTVSAASETDAEKCGESTTEEMLGRKEDCKKIFGIPFRIIPFKCSYCDKVFAEKNRAYSHEFNVHAKEIEADREKEQREGSDVESKTIAIDLRMFKCSFCGKVFQHMEHYKKHVRTHTKEKPHKCKYCDLSYAQEDSLYIHEHNVHGKGKDRYSNKGMAEDTANKGMAENTANKGEDNNKGMEKDTANNGEDNNKEMTEDTASKSEDNNKCMTEDTASKGEDSNKDMPEDTAKKGEDNNKDMTEDTANKSEDNNKGMTEDTASKGEDSNKDMPEDTAKKGEDSNKDMPEDTAKKGEDSNKDITEDTAKKGEDSNKVMIDEGRQSEIKYRDEDGEKAKEANAIAKEEKLKAKKRSLTCSECGKVSLCKYQHNNHVGSHTRKRQRIEANKVNLKCNECGKVSRCRNEHIHHVDLHKKCTICKEKFPIREALSDHMRDVHGKTKGTYPPKRPTEETANRVEESNKDTTDDTANKGEESNKDTTKDTANKGIDSNKDMTDDTANKGEESNKDTTKDTANKGEESNKGMTKDTANKGEESNKGMAEDTANKGEDSNKDMPDDTANKGEDSSKDMTKDTANKGEDSNIKMKEDTANRVKGKERRRRTRFLHCSRCGNIFRSKRDLDNHVKKHEGTAGPVRNNIVHSKRDLDNHVKKHEGTAGPVRNRPYTCKQCGHVSHTQSDHIRHIKIHPPGKRPHQCQECEKSFVLKQSLTIHVKRMHLNLKPHKCSVCDRAFSMRYRLALHTRIHTGEKPFTCEYCKKTFRFKNVMKTHLAQHTGERPHVCDHCSKTFVKKSVLNIHLRTHTTETKIQCPYCDRAFGDKKYLNKHLKTHMAVS